MAATAVIIGQPALCARLERQLDLLKHRPTSLGWIVSDLRDARVGAHEGAPILGAVTDLEAILARRNPALALVTLPAAMFEQVRMIRTRLRRAGVLDRFFPTLEDQLVGIGPRTHLAIDPAELLKRSPRSIDERAVAKMLRARRVLITGAGGSIGSELARLAARYAPAVLTLIDRSENALFEIDRQIARFHPALARRPVLHDVVRERDTRKLFHEVQPEIIFHAAAHKHVPMMEDHPAAAIDNNLFGTKSVADAADAVGAERCVIISTDKAVNPTSMMGATKRLAEMYVQALAARSATAFSIVRFGNVLGSSGSVLDVWSKQIAEGGPMTLTDPRMTRYFMTISEAAALVAQAASMPAGTGEPAAIYVLDMGQPVSILDLALRYARLHGLEPVLNRETSIDHGERSAAGAIRIVTIGARPGEKIHETLARDPESLEPTAHAGINRLCLPALSEAEMTEIITRLRADLRPRDPCLLTAEVAACVPEMAPQGIPSEGQQASALASVA